MGQQNLSRFMPWPSLLWCCSTVTPLKSGSLTIMNFVFIFFLVLRWPLLPRFCWSRTATLAVFRSPLTYLQQPRHQIGNITHVWPFLQLRGLCCVVWYINAISYASFFYTQLAASRAWYRFTMHHHRWSRGDERRMGGNLCVFTKLNARNNPIWIRWWWIRYTLVMIKNTKL